MDEVNAPMARAESWLDHRDIGHPPGTVQPDELRGSYAVRPQNLGAGKFVLCPALRRRGRAHQMSIECLQASGHLCLCLMDSLRRDISVGEVEDQPRSSLEECPGER